MEEGEYQGLGIIWCQIEQMAGSDGVHGHTGMAQLRALGKAGCTGGIKDDRGIFRFCLFCITDYRCPGDQLSECLGCSYWRFSFRIRSDDVKKLTGRSLLKTGIPLLGHWQFRRTLKTKISLGSGIHQMIGDFTAFEQYVQGHSDTADF